MKFSISFAVLSSLLASAPLASAKLRFPSSMPGEERALSMDVCADNLDYACKFNVDPAEGKTAVCTFDGKYYRNDCYDNEDIAGKVPGDIAYSDEVIQSCGCCNSNPTVMAAVAGGGLVRGGHGESVHRRCSGRVSGM